MALLPRVIVSYRIGVLTRAPISLCMGLSVEGATKTRQSHKLLINESIIYNSDTLRRCPSLRKQCGATFIFKMHKLFYTSYK